MDTALSKKFQGRTTSKNVVFRVLLKGLGFVLTAGWICLIVGMKRLGFSKCEISRLLRSTISYQRIFVANEPFLDSPLLVLDVHKDSFLLLTTEQLSRIGQSLWR